jgi:hypothetical protein
VPHEKRRPVRTGRRRSIAFPGAGRFAYGVKLGVSVTPENVVYALMRTW